MVEEMNINRRGCYDGCDNDSSLLFFFLILVVLFQDCDMFGDCQDDSLLFFFLLLVIIFGGNFGF